jgi:hypothetical protein
VGQVLTAPLQFKNKEEARGFFQGLRQKFIDWNYAAMGHDEFARLEGAINNDLRERTVQP